MQSDYSSDQETSGKEEEEKVEQTPTVHHELDPEKLAAVNVEIMTKQQEMLVQQEDFLFKVIIVGNSNVGKSCLKNRLVNNEFDKDQAATVGVEFGYLMLKIDELIIKLQLWDTGGQEQFESLARIFYRDAHIALLTYSIANNQSFEKLSTWLSQVRQESDPDVLLCMVGNQKDLEDTREVQSRKAEKFKKDNKLPYFIETSALTGDGVNELITMSAKMAYLKYQHKIRKSKLQKKDSLRKPKVKKLNSAAKKESEDCKCFCA